MSSLCFNSNPIIRRCCIMLPRLELQQCAPFQCAAFLCAAVWAVGALDLCSGVQRVLSASGKAATDHVAGAAVRRLGT